MNLAHTDVCGVEQAVIRRVVRTMKGFANSHWSRRRFFSRKRGMLRQNPIPVLSVTRTRCRQSCCMNWALRINHKAVHMTADIVTRWSWYGDRSSTSWTNRCRRNRKWKLPRIEMIGQIKFKGLWRHLKVDVGQFWMWDPQSRRCYPKRNVRVGNHISHFRTDASPEPDTSFVRKSHPLPPIVLYEFIVKNKPQGSAYDGRYRNSLELIWWPFVNELDE